MNHFKDIQTFLTVSVGH